MSNTTTHITVFPVTKKYLFTLLVLLFLQVIFYSPIQAQFVKTWDEVHGGQGFEELAEIYETADGYDVFGAASYTPVGMGDPPLGYGNADFWMYKTDKDGNHLTGFVYGGSERDILTYVEPLANGDYLLGGFSNSGISGTKTEALRGDPPVGLNDDRDCWVVKVDATGTPLWDKTYGGDSLDYLNVILPTPDGGYFIGGWTASDVGDEVSQVSRGKEDMWLIKIDVDGNYEWDMRYGGDDTDFIHHILPTSDGNYLLCGQSRSGISGDKTVASFGSIDIWVIKIDPLGNIIWDRAYGGERSEQPDRAIVGPNGNYYLGGYSRSTGGMGNKVAPNLGDRDYWLIELDNNGNKLLDRTYGGDGRDHIYNVKLFNKNLIALIGLSSTGIDGTKTEANRGGNDFWLVLVDEDGNEVYQKTLGGQGNSQPFTVGNDNARDAIQLEDGSIIIGGLTTSETGLDITDDRMGFQDGLMFKLDCLLDEQFDLGPDTTICQLEPLFFDVTVPGECEYLWNDGFTDPIRIVFPEEDGYYHVTVTNIYGCLAVDSIYVNTKPIPEGDLGPDQELCVGDSLLLDPSSIETDYLWSTGDTTSTLWIYSGGAYTVMINNDSLCSITENIIITSNPLPIIDIGLDTVRICSEGDLTLTTGHSGPDFLWSPNGETSPTVTINTPGEYSVIVTDDNGCSATDTMQLVHFLTPIIDLGNDTTICLGNFITLDAQLIPCTNCIYEWDDGNMNDVRVVSPTMTTTYSVTVTDDEGCEGTDEITIMVNELPTVDLGGNEEICTGDSITIVFTLTGEPPFNVTYNDGVKDSLLTNILDGHSITVMPTMTTTYTVVSIEDSSIPSSCSGLGGMTKTIFVYDTALTMETMTLCEGDSLFLEGVWQLESGTFYDTLQTYQSCDSVIITDLVVNPVDTMNFDFTTCDPNEAGVVIDILTNQYNCDSLIITTTTLLPSDTFNFFNTTCIPSMAGIDTTFLTNQHGCDSLIINEIQLLPSDTLRFNVTSCLAEEIGVDTSFLTNQHGCDSLIIETTTLLPSDTIDVMLTSCDPLEVGIDTLFLTNQYDCDSLVIEITSLLRSDTMDMLLTTCDPLEVGIDTIFMDNQFGCDSLIIEITDLLPSDTVNLTATSCDIADIGMDTIFMDNQFGCDSLVIVTTSLLPSDTLQLGSTTCNPAEAGIDTTFLTNQWMCDSIIVMTTVLLPSDTIYNSMTTCIPSEAGVDTTFLINQWQCDSLIINTITLSPSDTMYFTDTTCDPLEAGVDTMFLLNQYDCDSLVITMIDLLPSDTIDVMLTSCDPLEVGVDTLFLTNQYDCDSTIYLTTTLVLSDTMYFQESTCDATLNPSDTTFLNNQYGCDSLIILDRIFFSPDTIYMATSSCELADIGVDTVFLTNINSCDSLVITNTSYSLSDTTFSTVYSCDMDALGIDTLFFTTLTCDSLVVQTTLLSDNDTTLVTNMSCDPNLVGENTFMLTSSLGCDSIVITTTTLIESDTVRLDETSCSMGDVGIDTLFLTNEMLCDSMVIITTTFSDTDIVLFAAETCDPILIGVDTVFLLNQYGCDSLTITTTALLPNDTTNVIQMSCDPMETGIDTQTFPSLNGMFCDSVVITNTTLSMADTTFVSMGSCDPFDMGIDTMSFNTLTCDSIVITTTTPYQIDTTYLSASSCDPMNVGISTIIISTLMCDSVVVTTTTLGGSDTTYVDAMTCDPVDVGVMEEMFVGVNCDSVVITTTTLGGSDTTYVDAMTCDPVDVGVMEEMYAGVNCDSLVITTTTLGGSDTTYVADTSCDPIDLGIMEEMYAGVNCDSLVITTTTYALADTMYVNTFTCDPLGETVETEVFPTIGCDSVVITTYDYVLPDTTYIDAFTCVSTQEGMDTILYGSTTCDSLVITNTIFIEIDTTYISDSSCNPLDVGTDTLFISTVTCDSIVIISTSLNPTDTTYLFTQACDPAEAGVFEDAYFNQYGCDSLVINTVEYSEIMEGFVEQYTCDPLAVGMETVIDVASNGCDSMTLVTTLLGTDTMYFAAISCLISEVGETIEVYTNEHDCDSLIITNTTLIPENITYFEEFTCDSLEVTQDTIFLLSTDNCDSIVINQISLLQIDILADINDVICWGEETGAIIIESSIGGLSPYLYSLNNGVFTDQLVFSGLEAGDYNLIVQDANGCETSEAFLVGTESELYVDMGPADTTLLFGQTYDISIETNELLDTMYWSTINGLSCVDCMDPTAAPIFTTTYVLTVVDENGCTATDELTIYIDRRTQVFVPSAFSPNGDGINDYLTVYAGPGVSLIKSFHVYDRWGECNFSNFDFPPNDETQGWDGMFRRQVLNPAVFVYVLEAEFLDGRVEVFSGDVTLAR